MSGDWVEGFSKKHDKKYWKNKTTGKTSWTDPTKDDKKATGSKGSDTTKSIATKSAPTEWVEGFSKKHDRKYWKNATTGKTSWTDPNSEDGNKSAEAHPSSSASAPEQESHSGTGSSEWEEGFNKKHNRKYWKNKATGKISWKQPVGSTAAADDMGTAPAPGKPPSDPKGKTSSQQPGKAEGEEGEWVEGFSKKHDKKYWKNKTTGKTSWVDPTKEKQKATGGEMPDTKSTAAKSASVSTEWVEGFSKKHDRKYWKNARTGKTSWTDPNSEDGNKSAEAHPSSSASAPEQESNSGSSSAKEKTPPQRHDNEEEAEKDEWVEGFSKKHDKKYWKNKTTGKTSWVDPTKEKQKATGGEMPDTKSTAAKSASVSTEWVEGFSKKHDRKYWKNARTGKTSWTDPNSEDGNKSAEAHPSSSASAPEQESHSGTGSSEWEEGFNKKHNRKYWKNKATGKISWKQPVGSTAAADDMGTAPAPGKPPSDPKEETSSQQPGKAEEEEGEWVEGFSKKHDKKYWKNKTTGKTSWTAPSKPTAAAKSSKAAATPDAAAAAATTVATKTNTRDTAVTAAPQQIAKPTAAVARQLVMQLHGAFHSTQLDLLLSPVPLVPASNADTDDSSSSTPPATLFKSLRMAGLRSIVCNDVSYHLHSLTPFIIFFKYAQHYNWHG